MAEVQKPVAVPETGAATTTTAPTHIDIPVVATEHGLEPVTQPKVEEPVKAEGETEAVAPVEEKKEDPVEPIHNGVLGYKAPGLKNVFRFSKRHFWFGEEPVPASSLNNYLRGEKAEISHPIVAWSSQTGKGLLYFVKHADQKESPAGVLNLSEVTDLAKDGHDAFHFKIHDQKHTFEAQSRVERDGWFIAVEKHVEDAKASKETVIGSEGYKEQLEKLSKPATLAAAAAVGHPKKENDVAPTIGESATTTVPATTVTPATAEEAVVPARTGSSSSSDTENKKKSKKSKSRSVSRGKRASIFGGLLGKKDKPEEKVEDKKETETETKTADVAPVLPEASTTTTAPIVTDEIPKPAEEVKAEDTATPAVVPVAEEKKAEEEKPKPAKRASIFGNFVEKLKSPTTEKKESEVGPAAAAPVKDTEAPVAEASKVEETPALGAPATTETTVEAPKADETKATTTTPAKEKYGFSFGKFLGGNKEKARSPSGEKAPTTTSDAPKIEEPVVADTAPVVPPVAPVAPITPVAVEPVADAPKEEAKEVKEEQATATTPVTQKKRGSIFGSLIGGDKKDGESSEKGFGGLFRKASKAGKSKQEKTSADKPAKVDEEKPVEATAAPVEEPAAPVAETTEPKIIGDVVPEAVSVGQAPKSAAPVASTA